MTLGLCNHSHSVGKIVRLLLLASDEVGAVLNRTMRGYNEQLLYGMHGGDSARYVHIRMYTTHNIQYSTYLQKILLDCVAFRSRQRLEVGGKKGIVDCMQPVRTRAADKIPHLVLTAEKTKDEFSAWISIATTLVGSWPNYFPSADGHQTTTNFNFHFQR